ncbi:MAG TPA: hypothetical protein VHV09_23420 [Trebonia sp.]|nr:hypothetical protein [Trebonia sp.]
MRTGPPAGTRAPVAGTPVESRICPFLVTDHHPRRVNTVAVHGETAG